jgi:hypothetical protein
MRIPQLYTQQQKGALTMKAVCAVTICILVLFQSACVTGDEITNYIIEPDGVVSFYIYRSNLTPDRTGENGKEDLDSYVRGLEDKQGDLFTKLATANAREVKIVVLRRISPASVLIEGQIPTFSDFLAYLDEESECTPISREGIRGFRCELSREPSTEKDQSENSVPQADSFSETRFSLAVGSFTDVQGFLPANNKRSALLDTDTIEKMWNSQIPKITLSLEWQIPENP